jgi:hypothetical protein
MLDAHSLHKASSFTVEPWGIIIIIIYNCNWVTPGGSSTVHIYIT